MSKVSSLVLGIASGAAMFGAIQYASGNDLRGSLSDRDTGTRSATLASTAAMSNGPFVNRSSKGDRAASSAKAGSSQTLSFQVHGLSDTSVLLRLAGSAPKDIRDQPASSSRTVSQEASPRKATVACEPPVSLLTDVAKLLQPGRCVT